ncbi:hypothetical protein FHX08_001247 [Rhizobium sp. BK529]|uniref:hypothetical protein n=1 Tax=unclassified Rhizobium TaxID=2613769 RepID=UPI00104F41D6|nr:MULTISPECIES: hypothetical protein [unclassified Rhizobium]MBB3590903.1 hypothetical protein [Rhizobium sp. BK529]
MGPTRRRLSQRRQHIRRRSQIRRVAPFREALEDRPQQRLGVRLAILPGPKQGKVGGGADFPGFGALGAAPSFAR